MGRKKKPEDVLYSFYMSLTLSELNIIDRYGELLNAQIGESSFYNRNGAVRHCVSHVLKRQVEAAEKLLIKKQEELKALKATQNKEAEPGDNP